MAQIHRFSRAEILIGVDGLDRLKRATVAVVGLGGVGSYTAEALCRAGIGRLILIDFDDICLTNVNRQLHAMDGTIGRQKVQVMAERCRLINPEADIVPYHEFYSAENSDLLFAEKPDCIVDAIDHITSKIHLISSSVRSGVPVMASMGAANKLDPCKISVADIADTQICRMARIMRKLLRKA